MIAKRNGKYFEEIKSNISSTVTATAILLPLILLFLLLFLRHLFLDKSTANIAITAGAYDDGGEERMALQVCC